MRVFLFNLGVKNKMTKSKEIIINDIKDMFSINYRGYKIGLRAFPQSIPLFYIKGIKLLYGAICPSFKDAKEIVKIFLDKGMVFSERFSLSISKGIFIINLK